MRQFNKVTRTVALAGLLPCSAAARNISTAATPSRFGGGNAVATNNVTQMVDPWPRASANNNIASTARRWKPPSSAIAPTGSIRRVAAAPLQATGVERGRRTMLRRSDQPSRSRPRRSNKNGVGFTSMRIGRRNPDTNQTRVVVLTADAEFDRVSACNIRRFPRDRTRHGGGQCSLSMVIRSTCRCDCRGCRS